MHFDVILVGDLRVPGGTSRQVCNEIRVLSRAGYSVGLVNVELPHARGQKPLDRLIRARVAAGEAVLLQDGLDTLSAGLVIFENPRAFTRPPRPDLRIQAQEALIALHFPARDGNGEPTFEPARVSRVCREITDAPLRWAPTSPLTRQLLLDTYPDLKLMDGVLPCIVFADEFKVSRETRRGRIALGRHSRPELDKWPATRQEVLRVYPADEDVDVVLLGVDERLQRLMRRYPGNWRTYGYGEIAPQELLRQIDFFVYYHHPRWVEAFGMATAEAMASGAVAVLPEYMRVNFGDGAVYQPAEDALAAVRALHGEQRACWRQAQRGMDHVRRHYSPAAYLAALKPHLRKRQRTKPPRLSRARHDLVILADMRRSGQDAFRISREVMAASAAGYSVALVHAPAGKPAGRVRPEIDACVRRGFAVVADLERQPVHARLLVTHGTQAFLGLDAAAAENLTAERVVVVLQGAVPATELELVQRLLRSGKTRVSFAPTSDLARAQLEGSGTSMPLDTENWGPVCLQDSLPLPRRGKIPVVAVVAGNGWEAGDLRRLREMLPADGSLRVKLHGAPRDKVLQPFLPLNGWETFKPHELPLAKALDGADALFCTSAGGLADVAAAEAMTRGLPVVATAELRREFGDGAVYCQARDAKKETLALLKSRRRREDAIKAGRRRANRLYSTDAYEARLRTLMGPPRRRPAARGRDRRRVLMVSQNGVGLGHVARQLAVSAVLSRSHDVVFCSMSQAFDVIAAQGYTVEHLPSHVYSGVNYGDWHGWARAQLEQMIDFYGIGAVVLDGSVPYLGLIEAVAPREDVRLAWIRRPMWPTSADSSLRLAQQRFFDLVIEPEEAAGTLDTGPTVAHRERALCVPPIRLLETDELLSREEAAAALGLDASRPAMLVQLGSGTNHDVVTLTERIVRQARLHPGLQVAIAEWHNADQKLDLWDGVVRLRGFPYSRYFNAFDLSFSAAGYNSFHEILAFGLPTAFIPNPREYMDGQGIRAGYADSRGAGVVCSGSELEIGAALQRLMDPKQQRAMRAAMRRLRRPNGAAQAAAAIARLLEHA